LNSPSLPLLITILVTTAAAAVFLLPFADIRCNGERMYFDLTNYENIIAAFALVLIIIFALAAFLDNRWRKAEPFRDFGSDHKPNSPQESTDKDRASRLYAYLCRFKCT
jgi:amino acid transporter